MSGSSTIVKQQLEKISTVLARDHSTRPLGSSQCRHSRHVETPTQINNGANDFIHPSTKCLS